MALVHEGRFFAVTERWPTVNAYCWFHREGHPCSPWAGLYLGDDRWQVVSSTNEPGHVFKPTFITHWAPMPPLPAHASLTPATPSKEGR